MYFTEHTALHFQNKLKRKRMIKLRFQDIQFRRNRTGKTIQSLKVIISRAETESVFMVPSIFNQ